MPSNASADADTKNKLDPNAQSSQCDETFVKSVYTEPESSASVASSISIRQLNEILARGLPRTRIARYKTVKRLQTRSYFF